MQKETLWVDSNLKKINFDFVKNRPDINGTSYAYGLNETQMRELGYSTVDVFEKPEDYSDETYYRTEQDETPYVVYPKKSQEQLDQLHNAKIKAQIASIEAGQARAVREAALGDTQHLQDIETAVVLLRGQLKPEPVQP